MKETTQTATLQTQIDKQLGTDFFHAVFVTSLFVNLVTLVTWLTYTLS